VPHGIIAYVQIHIFDVPLKKTRHSETEAHSLDRRTFGMRSLWALVRVSFTPITIMIVPHSMSGFVKLKISLVVVYAVCAFTTVTLLYMLYLGANNAHYLQSRLRLDSELKDVRSTLTAFKKTEKEFRGILALGSKTGSQPRAASWTVDTAPAGNSEGAVEDEEAVTKALKGEIRQAIESVSEIRNYLNEKRDVFLATPAGLPVNGRLTSGFGLRHHPVTGNVVFHRGIDIGVARGTPVRATADGIVSYSGWAGGSGNMVVLEHGFGYETIYAHGSGRLVEVRQLIKRGDPVIVSGATGLSTGPHVHYEVWRGGRQVDPLSSIQER
jgi:murein DD-endopeptidase MepM/ murein hydrolase activator NlpD